jgi:hypothetical protein
MSATHRAAASWLGIVVSLLLETGNLEMQQIADAEQRIRALTNEGMYERVFATRRDDWNQLCVAMDTLGDSVAALLHFESCGLGSSVEERYIRLYGMFQAIILQQDAISAIYRIYIGSELKVPKGSAWLRCRKLRNKATGHPVDYQHGTFRVFLSRNTITDDGFTLLIAQKGQQNLTSENVDFQAVYNAYKGEALDCLGQVQERQENLVTL